MMGLARQASLLSYNLKNKIIIAQLEYIDEKRIFDKEYVVNTNIELEGPTKNSFILPAKDEPESEEGEESEEE